MAKSEDNSQGKSTVGQHKKLMTPPQWNSFTQILLHAIKGGARSLLYSYSIRTTIAFFLKLLQKRKDLKKCLIEAGGESSIRFSAMITSFTFIWKLVCNSLYYYNGNKGDRKVNGAIAGFLAGFAILFETKENRIGYAQQFFMRSMQAGKNALKQRDMWKIPHGDSILFSLATASVVYAYGFYPSTIPKSYYNWILQKARVPKKLLQIQAEHSNNLRKLGPLYKVDQKSILETFEKVKGTKENLAILKDYILKHNGAMPGIPCVFWHPSHNSSIEGAASLWISVFKDMFPVYLALTAIPMTFLKYNSFIAEPWKQLRRILKSVTRSSIFIASLLTTFKGGMCLYFQICPTSDTRLWVYPMAFIAGLWIFFEQKGRRAELAMFCLPKALQSVYEIMISKGTMLDIPNIEVGFTCISTSVLMALYQDEHHHISGILAKLMRATLGEY